MRHQMLGPTLDTGLAPITIQNSLDNRTIRLENMLQIDIHNVGLRSLKLLAPSLHRNAIPSELR